MGGLLHIRTACVERALRGHPDVELLVARAETRIEEVLATAEVIDQGSRRERSDAVRWLIDLVGSDTPDLIDAVVAAATNAIREIAAEEGWSETHTSRLEEQVASALIALERTLDALAPA